MDVLEYERHILYVAKHDFEMNLMNSHIFSMSHFAFILLISVCKFRWLHLQKASGFWQSFRTWVQPNLGKKDSNLYFLMEKDR